MGHWDHLEGLLGELYRREVENEENIWRSLPFFSATLAVEVAVVTQALPLVARLGGWSAWVAAGAAALAMLLVAAVVLLLYRSIRPARFRYIASEPELVSYVAQLEAGGEDEAGGASPEAGLRRLLVQQYADATANNRAINQRRARARTNAGVLLLASIVVTLVLVAATVTPQLVGRVFTGDARGQGSPNRPDRPPGDDPARGAPAGAGRAAEGGAPADAAGQEGLVDGPRGAAPDGGGQAKVP